MAKSGMNSKTLQYLMGHSDIGVTLNTYTHLGELCPALSLSSIEGALRKLVKAGELKREGSGKGTYYVRLK